MSEKYKSLEQAIRQGDFEKAKADALGLVEGGTSPLDIFSGCIEPTLADIGNKFSRLEIAELLFERGADIEAPDREGKTALMHAVASNDQRMNALLMFFEADVDTIDERGNTPLMHAAMDNARVNAERLIDNGADIDARNQDGRTALGIALEYGYDEFAEMLRRYGAKE